MRMLLMLAIGFGGSSLLMPMLALAQSTPEQVASQTEAARKFRAYLDEDWKRWMEEYPEAATGVGYPGQNRRWTDDSPAGIEKRKKHLAASLTTLRSISREALPASERLNYDLYLDLLETSTEGVKYGDDPMPFRNVVPRSLWMPLNQMEGIQQGAAETLANMPRQNVADYEDILARLEALPKSVDENIALLQDGLKRGYSPPKLMLRDVPKQFADLVPAKPLSSPLLETFTEFPSGFSEAERTRLTERAKNIYSSAVAPAFRKLRDYLVTKYLPACRE